MLFLIIYLAIAFFIFGCISYDLEGTVLVIAFIICLCWPLLPFFILGVFLADKVKKQKENT